MACNAMTGSETKHHMVKTAVHQHLTAVEFRCWLREDQYWTDFQLKIFTLYTELPMVVSWLLHMAASYWSILAGKMELSYWLFKQEIEFLEGSRIQKQADHNKTRGTIYIGMTANLMRENGGLLLANWQDIELLEGSRSWELLERWEVLKQEMT